MPAAAAPYRVVWALLVLAWVGNYCVRLAPSALLPSIMQELDLSYSRAGILATALFYSYAVMNFPAGILGDRFGRRRMVTIGLVAGGLASMATGLAGSFATLVVARLATGLSQGCLFSNDRAIIVAVTPPEKVTLGQAVSFTGPGLGIALGLLVGGALGERMSWRWVFVLFGLVPIVAALLIWRFVPRLPPSPAPAGGGRLRAVVTDRELWILSLASATVMWLQFVVILWGPLLFIETGVKDLGRAGLFSSLTGLAAALGLLLGGLAGHRAQGAGHGQHAALLPSFAAMTLAAAGTALAVQWQASAVALGAGVFLTTMFAWSAWGPVYALIGGLFRRGDMSSAFGFSNTIMVLGAIAGPAAAGWIRDVTGSFATGLYLSAAMTLAGAALLAAFGRAGRARPADVLDRRP